MKRALELSFSFTGNQALKDHNKTSTKQEKLEGLINNQIDGPKTGRNYNKRLFTVSVYSKSVLIWLECLIKNFFLKVGLG